MNRTLFRERLSEAVFRQLGIAGITLDEVVMNRSVLDASPTLAFTALEISLLDQLAKDN